MTRREEIELAWLNKAVQSNHRYDEKSFKEAVEWADKTMIDKLRELKCGYENNLDTKPHVYEIHIQLCAKLSLIEKLIIELEEE